MSLLVGICLAVSSASAALPPARPTIQARLGEMETVVQELRDRQAELVKRIQGRRVALHTRLKEWTLQNQRPLGRETADSKAEAWELTRAKWLSNLLAHSLKGLLALKQEEADALFLDQQIQAERSELLALQAAPVLRPLLPRLAFEHLKGKLPLPLAGEVRGPSGRGVEIVSKDSNEVRAVAAGRVVYVGQLPTYGRVAILDHGDHYFSLLGHLGDFLKKPGEAVIPGEILGTVEPQFGALYFELRSRHVALNPLQWVGPSSRFGGI